MTRKTLLILPICCGWADCPKAWIAPAEIRELRELTGLTPPSP
jgi:hypothetical protein